MEKLYKYKAMIIRVVDADTVDAQVDLGFGIKITHRFRVNDYDAPETWRPRNKNEKIHGRQATARAIELLAGSDVYLISTKIPGIYGRYGADIILEDGRNFKDVMISEGFSKKDQY
jgi:micrococcal nuclease